MKNAGSRAGIKVTARDICVALIAVAAATGAQYIVDLKREYRAATNSLVQVFNDSYLGTHRDRISAFALSEPALCALGYSDKPCADITELVLADRDVQVSLFAITSFFADVNACIAEGRCNENQARNAFKFYANDFLEIFEETLFYFDTVNNVDRMLPSVSELATRPVLILELDAGH